MTHDHSYQEVDSIYAANCFGPQLCGLSKNRAEAFGTSDICVLEQAQSEGML